MVANKDGSPKEYVTVPGAMSLWDVIAKMRANDAASHW